MSPGVALDLRGARLRSQGLVDAPASAPEQVVSWLVGLQGQDLASAKWSIGLRVPGATEAEVDEAFAARRILRTWPMRGTLHVVAAPDVRWLLALTAPGNLARAESRHRQLELDGKTAARSLAVFSRALRGGASLTREELCAALARAKISTAGQRGYHLLWHAAVRGLICTAAPRGKAQTFALLDEWVPPTPPKSREASLVELAQRYFESRGPATLQDFAWWSGLGLREARVGLEGARLASETVKGTTWWRAPGKAAVKTPPTAFALPGFDEYLLGYQDRSGVLDPAFAERVCPGGNGVFAPTLVLGGKVVGTWKRAVKKTGVALTLQPFAALTRSQRRAAEAAVQRYADFLGLSARIECIA